MLEISNDLYLDNDPLGHEICITGRKNQGILLGGSKLRKERAEEKEKANEENSQKPREDFNEDFEEEVGGEIVSRAKKEKLESKPV